MRHGIRGTRKCHVIAACDMQATNPVGAISRKFVRPFLYSSTHDLSLVLNARSSSINDASQSAFAISLISAVRVEMANTRWARSGPRREDADVLVICIAKGTLSAGPDRHTRAVQKSRKYA